MSNIIIDCVPLEKWLNTTNMSDITSVINIIDHIPLEIWLHITNISGEINLLLTCTKLFGLFEFVDINAPINECEIAIKSIIKNNEIDVFKYTLRNTFNFKQKHMYFGNMAYVRLMYLSCDIGNLEILTEIRKYLCAKNIIEELDNYLSYAASGNHINIMDYIFNNSKNIRLEHINKVLIQACRNNWLDGVKYLVNKGADVNANKCEGFIEAIKTGNLEIIKYLVAQGVRYNDHSDSMWFWILHLKKPEIMEYMMSIGAHINLDDITIMNYIRNNESIKLIKYTVSKGYKFDVKRAIEFAKIFNRSSILKYLESVKN
ncbi:hypothetical protein [Niemeyer virus]|uniref:Ankyrin repeat protein n=1 Tax=Acanthamoeba polyphaga mimivirus Kroon TaxID=3069720 RepID=A0A0G2YBW4_9VIRU|nr:putative ankyrin repeat protein [Acanthamoeba polyphaga mimivirus]AKI80551.1 putative ankyrin repeat protein [Acanthamoeba polyphaga mimivirus Kroon]ALR84493.1 hypothetical protein [Niemeyer virus]